MLSVCSLEKLILVSLIFLLISLYSKTKTQCRFICFSINYQKYLTSYLLFSIAIISRIFLNNVASCHNVVSLMAFLRPPLHFFIVLSLAVFPFCGALPSHSRCWDTVLPIILLYMVINHHCSQDPFYASLPQFSPVLVHSIHRPSTTFNQMHMSSARSLLQAISYIPSSLLTSVFTQNKSIQNSNGKTIAWVTLSPLSPNWVLFSVSWLNKCPTFMQKPLTVPCPLFLLPLWPSRVGCTYQLGMSQNHPHVCCSQLSLHLSPRLLVPGKQW